MNSLHILSIITWLPVLGGIIIIALFKKDQSTLIKRFATVWFALDFVVSLYLIKYVSNPGGMQFLEDHQWIPVIGARYQMGADGVSVLLILLTTLLGVIAALSSWKYIQKREKEYYALLLFLQAAVLGVFTSMDLFPVLSVLRSVAGAHVLPDRHLGWREPPVRGDQVLSLYAGRFGRHAARHFEDVFPDAGWRSDRED